MPAGRYVILRFTFRVHYGCFWEAIKKNMNTTRTGTLRQEDSPVEEEDFDPNCLLRGQKLTLFEQKELKNKLLFGTEVVFYFILFFLLVVFNTRAPP